MPNTTSQIRVRWSNGHVDYAASWEALEEKVRHAQWQPWTEDEFRAVLSKRAMRWSATEIDIDGTSEELFHELQRARLVEVLDPNDDDYEEA